MEITSNKERVLFSCGLCLILLTIVLSCSPLYRKNEQLQITPFVLSIFLCLLIGILLSVKIKFTPKWDKRISIPLFFISPIISFACLELLNNHNKIFDLRIRVWLVNLGICLLVYFIVYLIANRISLTIIIAHCFLCVLGIIFQVVYILRGTPILPLDLLSIRTALNVASNYQFPISYTIITAVLTTLFLCILASKLHYVNKNRRFGIAVKLSGIIVFSVFLFAFFETNFLTKYNMCVDLWDQLSSYKSNGMLLNFSINSKFLIVEQPSGYSSAKVRDIIQTKPTGSVSFLGNDNGVKQKNTFEGKKPTVIAIMNESFADLNVITELKTNVDPLPFLNGLTEDTIKGSLFVSNYGGGTSNSEFEFLTGNSIAFLPKGSIAYQQYIIQPMDSFASILKKQGYHNTAIHPFNSNSWKRDVVYPLLGFDEFISFNAFENLEENKIRSYISDRATYQKIIELYEAKSPDEDLFVFTVTIQNHGGYSDTFTNMEQTITLDPSQFFLGSEEYLSLINASDTAFQELIEYFQEQEDPVVVLMFGDHHPRLSQENMENLFGKPISELSLEEYQKQFQVPFVIWSNYDIPERSIDQISTNYLSGVLMEILGMEMPPYQKFLAAQYQQIPVINVNGYMDAEGNHYSFKDKSTYLNNLNDYSILQYNNLFDLQNRQESVFSLK